ncbi:DUF2169 domain-containing protein [Desulfonatronum sp. SC1]|uniref:DUF2169 family type VI secretion system accessory protein n=1 Tax=Desulfonatronum sp. SC1 TaxID=2109626 RepID=UPI000D30A343|nr:DUF2169 domain-containing protein [Desulfonatronum sp. SC1]PTN36715.1 hypothetical protein C6366_08690 [Desulfonatronum sp. SC1]
MKVVKELTQGILLNYFSIRNTPHLVVSMLTFFDLDNPAAPLSEQEMWKFAPLELGANAVLDAAMPKPKAEVLLRARCFALDGLPRKAARVSFRVGNLEKRLNVFGPRRWERKASGLAITDPEPFTELDIAWSNAFGGRDFEKNPLGRGSATVQTPSGAQIQELPCVEAPDRMIGAPTDRPDPAGFMPLDQTWPQRRSKAGTYDQKWFQEHWPYFPEDMNWTFFNTAPEDQQLDAFFQGGETVELVNMHPERQVVTSTLPRLRQRVFFNQLQDLQHPDKGLQFREVQTNLDTVWLFPHALRGILVHRAVVQVQDEEAVDVKHLYLVTEQQAEPPKSLEHYLDALNRRLDRSVQVDMSQFDAAMAQVAQGMKQVKDIPKAVAHSLDVAQGKAPNAGISPQNAANQCIALLDQSKPRMEDAARQLGEMKKQFGHMVKIDLKPFAASQAKFTALQETIRRQMATAQALTQKAEATKSGLREKVLKSLDRPETRQFIPLVQAQTAPPERDIWAEQALELVRQGRYDLSLDHERLTALRNLGLRPVTIKRAMLGVLPRETPFSPEEWGLEQALVAPLPAGLILVAHVGPRMVKLVLRPGDLNDPSADLVVPGSQDAVFGAGLSPGKVVIRVADPLEAWLVEQDAGDYVGAAALPAPNTPPGTPLDKEAASVLEAAPRLLVVLYSRGQQDMQKEFEPWKKAYPQAEPLALPEKSALLDAHGKGVDLEQWILDALGPAQAPFVPEDSPFRAKKGPSVGGISLPLVDAKGLYQASEAAMSAKMAPMLARGEALKKELPEQMNALIEKARGQMRKDGLDKKGINPEEYFKVPPPPKKAEGFMAGLDMASKFGSVRQSLGQAGQATPQRLAALDAQEAKMTKVLADAKAQWAAGQAKLPGAKGFAFPDWAKKLLEPFHIDPDDTEVMTREIVVFRHGENISLKGKNLNGLDLSGLDLTGIDLRGCQLQKTSFVGSKLDGADLSGVIADEADFTGASFKAGKAVQALLGKAVFAEAVLTDTNFSKALLKEADLTRAELSRSTLEQTLLEGAKLGGAKLVGAKAGKGYFMSADLSGADLSDADATKAVFFKATTEKTNFSRGKLNRAVFWDTQADAAAFRDADLDNARFGGTATVKDGDFTGAKLDNASLINADLSGSDFRGARFERSYLRNCNLSQADLSGVSAKRTMLHRTNLEGANLSRANLFLGSLRKARLVNTDLSQANLYGAELYKATVGETNFDETNLKMTLLHKRVDLLDDQK